MFETKLWGPIASRAFLHGGVARIHGSLPEAFECTRTRDGNGNVIEVSYRYSQVKVTDTDTKNRALHALAWMILHDRLLDFASAHLKGAFKLIKSEGLIDANISCHFAWPYLIFSIGRSDRRFRV